MASAREAGLRYVSDAGPGIRRFSRGHRQVYIGPTGRPVRDTAVLKRIRSLVIPPAWTDVWICPDPKGHLQATGRDARGRKQYRYHPRWREVRDETKYDRMLAFGRLLPRIRRRVARDLSLQGLSRDKIMAAVIRLLETTLIRVGNDEYARTNESFGLTTMRDRHVKVNGASMRFEFRGKSGVLHRVDLTDRRLARIVRQSRDLPGYELFQYVDEHGERRAIDASDVNDYLRNIAGEEFTAKDFRTWAGTVLAARALWECGRSVSKAQAKRHLLTAVEAVAKRLGNTKAVCRKCYIHPDIMDAYLDGTLVRVLQQRMTRELRRSNGRMPDDEQAVLACLKQRLQPKRRSTAPQRAPCR